MTAAPTTAATAAEKEAILAAMKESTTPPAAAKEEEEEESEGGEEAAGRSCNFCGEATALLYCRADSARLCLACDRHVHTANSVSSKHHRSLLCDSCLSAPSSFLRHSLLLCPNCDFDAAGYRGGSGDLHRPVEPFSGCPPAAEMLSLLGVVGEDEKALVAGDGGNWWLDGDGDDDEGFSLLVWETPPILSLDDLIVPTSSGHGYPAIGVPPPPKDRNATCGRHKEEIIRQLRELVQSENNLMRSDFVFTEQEIGELPTPPQGFQLEYVDSAVQFDAAPVVVPDHEASALHGQSDCNERADVVSFTCEHFLESSMEKIPLVLDGFTDITGSGTHAHVVDLENLPLISKESLPYKGGHELAAPDRESALSRYKEKRKTRRYDKHIRYESRKARADGRMRINGRFAKVIRDT